MSNIMSLSVECVVKNAISIKRPCVEYDKKLINYVTFLFKEILKLLVCQVMKIHISHLAVNTIFILLFNIPRGCNNTTVRLV